MKRQIPPAVAVATAGGIQAIDRTATTGPGIPSPGAVIGFRQPDANMPRGFAGVISV
jgi:hypothetical protein